jgi:2-isopropylmalate synthase
MVQILDATLREGEQTPGVYFPSHIKLAIAQLLDEIGIDIIETGHPLVTKEIEQAVQQIAHSNIRAKVGAHARSLKKDVDKALECGVEFLGIFYCVSDERLEGVFKKDLGQAITEITTMIRYAKEQNPNLMIRYTPEDTVRSEFKNVIEAATAAVHAGADIISIADTTGFMVPGTKGNMFDYVTKLRTELAAHGAQPKIAVHCHNDKGCALGNALDAYRAGADIIDVSVLGLGERAGIVDLAQLLTTLKQNFDVENDWDLHKLTELYELVSQHAGVPIPVHFPIMGANAFTHCAGVHTQAATQNPTHYQSLDPESVGRETKISLDHMSGIASITHALEQIGETTNDRDFTLQVLNRVKEVGQTGRIVELDELRHIVEWMKRDRENNGTNTATNTIANTPITSTPQTSNIQNDISIILVGGTGVGKTTLIDNIQQHFPFKILNRRIVVDEHVLPAYEAHLKAQGIAFDPSSRTHRFNSTAWNMQNGNPGLGKLAKEVIEANTSTQHIILFDNLRGEREVEFALNNINNAIFIGLDAPDEVRIRRIMGRGDSFDNLTGEEQERYEKAKATVKRESENYNLKETFQLLQSAQNKGRTLYINTEENDAEACLQQALRFIRTKTTMSEAIVNVTNNRDQPIQN